jgi:hypothetical protein
MLSKVKHLNFLTGRIEQGSGTLRFPQNDSGRSIVLIVSLF